MELIENAVPLADVAKVLKSTPGKVETEARALQLTVGEDWAGRAAVSQTDARELTSGAARRRQNHDERWAEHLLAAREWEAARERAVQAAAQPAYASAKREQLGDPEANSRAQQAGIAAGRAFEASNPPPTLDGHTVAQRRFSDPSGLRRVAQRIKEVVVA